MKTKLAIFVMGLLLMGSSAFAADGDLVVNGNAKVGGDIYLVKDGQVFTTMYVLQNFGEDVYGSWVLGNPGETCKANYQNFEYTCEFDASKTCIDTKIGGDGKYYYRNVVCRRPIVFLSAP